MTPRPEPRKSTLAGRHPAAPSTDPEPSSTQPAEEPARRKRTQTKTATKRRGQLVFYTDDDLAGQVRAAIQEIPYSRTGYRSMSDLIDHAVRQHIAALQAEHNNGQPWKHVHPGEVGTGRRGF